MCFASLKQFHVCGVWVLITAECFVFWWMFFLLVAEHFFRPLHCLPKSALILQTWWSMKHLFLAFSVEIQLTENEEVVLVSFLGTFVEEVLGGVVEVFTGVLCTADLGTNAQYRGFDKKLNAASFEDSTACS